MKLIRQPSTPQGTFGTWYNDDGSVLCQTVELPWDNNERGESCLPAVPTVFKKYDSPRHGQVWLAQNTAPRTDCEIHSANFWFQLEGCIAVGDGTGHIRYEGPVVDYQGQILPAVLNSVNMLNMLREKLPDTFTLDISWAQPLNTEEKTMGTSTNIINSLGNQVAGDVIGLVLPELENIQEALTEIQDSKGDIATSVTQYGVIIANLNQIIAVAPALIPLLEETALSGGAGAGAAWIGNLITKLQSLIPTSSGNGTATKS